MGIRLIVEVLDNAPGDLTPVDRLLLIVIAEKANDGTRIGFPGWELIAGRMGWSGHKDGGKHAVTTAVKRLAARGYEIRVPVGKDKQGRPVYAHKDQRTNYRIPEFPRRATLERVLGTATLGQGCSTVAPFPAPKGAQPEPKGCSTVPPKGAQVEHPFPHIPSKKQPSSSSGDPHLSFLADRLKIDEDEAERLLQKIKGEKTFTNLGGYLRKISNEDYAAHLDEIRSTAASRPLWCGRCDETTRKVQRVNSTGKTVDVRCTCHPDTAAGGPSQPQRRQPWDGRRVSSDKDLESWLPYAARDDPGQL